MKRVTVILQPDEKEALVTLARRERRDPRDQAAIILRCELERRGLLPTAERTMENMQREVAQ